MSTRTIIVDHTSSLISYQGQWSALPDNASYVSPFRVNNYTPNKLLSRSGSFTFNFIGRQELHVITVYIANICCILSLGTSVHVLATFVSFNSTQLSWTCFIDGVALQNIPPSSYFIDVEICASNVTMETTPNNLTVVVSGTIDNPFLFNFIEYISDTSTILDNSTVLVSASDRQIQYDSGWDLSEGQAETSVQGASMTFDFVGAFPQTRGFKYFL